MSLEDEYFCSELLNKIHSMKYDFKRIKITKRLNQGLKDEEIMCSTPSNY